MIGNLLDNAVKFTPPSGNISVTLRRKAGQAAIEVSDSGVGIDQATLTRLFEPFAQADRSLDRSGGGLGLGLAIVKSMAELHGGPWTPSAKDPGAAPASHSASHWRLSRPRRETAGTGCR